MMNLVIDQSKDNDDTGLADPQPEFAMPQAGEIDRLFAALSGADLPPRTRKLISARLPKKAKKLVEEATEVAIDALIGHQKGVIDESVDVLYHLVVLWHAMGVAPEQVWLEMSRRAESFGVAGKLPKRPKKMDIGPDGEEGTV